jgi:probable rRNA maturation factor
MSASLEIEDARWLRHRGVKAAIKRATQAALPARETRRPVILLTSDKHMKHLNHDWRGKAYATNVLSFAATAGPGTQKSLGDIALGYGVVMREAKQQDKPPLHHLQHLVVHGVLHLLGYDHEDDAEAERMERKERRILKTIGIPDPYKTT